MHQDSSAGLSQVAIMAVGIAVSMMVGPEVGGWLNETAMSGLEAMGDVALAEAGGVTVSPSTLEAAGSVFANSAFLSGGIGNVALSAAAGSMASSAATGALSGNFSLENVLKSGLTAGLTAGLTSAPLFDGHSLNQLANVQTTSGNVIGNFNPDTLGQNLLGM